MGRITQWLAIVITASVGVAQSPPGTLPEAIRATPQPGSPVRPAAATAPMAAAPTAKPTAAIVRFEKDPRAWPPETAQAVQSMRSSSAWLARIQQADGRFMGGINPALARPLDGTSEAAQALAAWAMVQAAEFTGEEKLLAAAGQAILAMLAQTKVEELAPACRVPTIAAGKNPWAYAALAALAIYHHPAADARLLADAEGLCQYLKTQVTEEGMLKISADAGKADAILAALTPGYCFQALAASNRVKPEAWKITAIERGLSFYRKNQPSVLACAAMLPAAVECASQARSETAAACVFEFADAICAGQYTTADAPSLRWVGSFRTGTAEPSSHCAECARGLVAALKYVSLVPDSPGVAVSTRYARYRSAAVGCLAFVRSLQMTDESCQHFEKSFRLRFLLGGVCNSTVDGNLRCDHAATFTIAQIAFLQSGAEKGE